MITRYSGEYGYNIELTANQDLSSATSAVLKAKNTDKGVTKSLSGTISGSVFTATVTQNFFDIEGEWELQLQVTYASSVLYQQTPTKIMIEEGL